MGCCVSRCTGCMGFLVAHEHRKRTHHFLYHWWKMAQNKTIFSQWNRQAMQINNVMVMECLAISCVSAVFNYLQCRELNSVPAVQLLFKQIAKWWYWKTPLVPNCMQFKKKKKKNLKAHRVDELIFWATEHSPLLFALTALPHFLREHISCMPHALQCKLNAAAAAVCTML